MSDTDLKTKTRSRTARPNRYTVLFHNDDYTPVEFVMLVMIKIFGQTIADAERITMDIHKKGRGAVGLYPYEVAESKVMQALDTAKRQGHPLLCSTEKA